jgi:hypothetical protein
MKSMKLLLKKVSLFLLKLALLVVLVGVTNYYAYQRGAQDSMGDYRELASTLSQATALLERQGRVMEHLNGEVEVMKMLATARVGGGFPALPLATPLTEEDLCPVVPKFRWRLIGPELPVSRALTSRK